MLKVMNILDLMEQIPKEALDCFLSSFECKQNRSIEYFLHHSAISSASQKFSITYLVINENQELAGFFTLANKSIYFNCAGRVFGKTLRRVKQFRMKQTSAQQDDETYLVPAYLIAQLAKNSGTLRGEKPTGSMLIDYSMQVLGNVQRQIGGGLIFLDCEDEAKLLAFYERHRFMEFGTRLSFSPSEQKIPQNALQTNYSSVLYHQMMRVF